MTDNNFIINLNTSESYITLFRALSDKNIRAGLKNRNDIQPGVRDVIQMLDDEKLIKMSEDLRTCYFAWLNGKVPIDELNASITKIQSYCTSRYPEGVKLGEEYARTLNYVMVKDGVTTSSSVNWVTIGQVAAVVNGVVVANVGGGWEVCALVYVGAVAVIVATAV